MIDENALNIYTDGSSKVKPRRGGIGIRYIFIDDNGKEVKENFPCPGYLGATNNEMELNACVIALKNCLPYLSRKYFQYINIFTDSNYVITNFTNAMFTWPSNKWQKKSGAPVLNVSLWKDLIKWKKKTRKYLYFKKVKGHSNDTDNIEVDILAKKSAEYPINKPILPGVVRRKLSKKKTRIGSVEILGQKISIRIIEGKYLPQKYYRYRYEVISRNSEYYRNVDFICSYEVLREAHSYYVLLNKDQNNPRIIKVYREILKKGNISELSAQPVAASDLVKATREND